MSKIECQDAIYVQPFCQSNYRCIDDADLVRGIAANDFQSAIEILIPKFFTRECALRHILQESLLGALTQITKGEIVHFRYDQNWQNQRSCLGLQCGAD